MGSISTKKLQENNLFSYSVDNIVKPYLKYACCLCRSIGAPSISYRFRTCIRTNSLRSSCHVFPQALHPKCPKWKLQAPNHPPTLYFHGGVAAWPVFRIVMQIGGFLSTGVCFWKKTQYLHQQLEVTISAKECLLQTSNIKKTTYIFLHSDFYHHHPFTDCDIHAWYFWYIIFILPHPIPTKSVLLMFGSQKTASEFNIFFKDHQPQHP